MKTSNIIAVALAATLFSVGLTSCGDDYDDSSIKDQITALDKRVGDLEAGVKALQTVTTALQANDYVTKVEKTEAGYKLTFAKSGEVIIKDGATPSISAKADGGVFYWAVDGEFLTIDGKKVPTAQSPVAVTDQVDGKIYWQVNGEWMLIDGQRVQATGDKGETGAQGPGLMVISEDGNVITFTIEGVEYKVNVAKSELTFDANDGKLLAGTTTETELFVNIPEGWAGATVRVDALAGSASGSTITRAVVSAITATATKVGTKVKVVLTTADGEAGEVAEVVVTMTNDKGEKRVGSTFLTVNVVSTTKETIAIDGSSTTVASAIAGYEAAHTVFTKIEVDGVAAMTAEDWAALQGYAYLSELEIGSNVTGTEIPANALAGSKLTSFTSNSSTLVTIGEGAFAGCSELTTVTATSITTIGANAFDGATKLTSMDWTAVTSIGAGAFANTRLTTVTFAAKAETIGAKAFDGCALTAVEFEVGLDALIGIADDAFAGVVGDAAPAPANRTGEEAPAESNNATLTFANGQKGVEASGGSPASWKGYYWKTITITP